MADTHESILAAAAARAREKNEPVAGLLTPAEAWALREAGEIQIVDTRTHAERDLVGYVPGTIHIEWYDYPAKVRNDRFVDDLRGKVDPGQAGRVPVPQRRALARGGQARDTERLPRRVQHPRGIRRRQEPAGPAKEERLAGGRPAVAAGLTKACGA
jgi:rhodanese-related sulfurtransferase